MDAQEIINYIATAPKKTPVKVYLTLAEGAALDLSAADHVFGDGASKVVFGDWEKLAPALEAAGDAIADMVVENDGRNTGVPLLDKRNIHARIEPGAIIRDKVEIGDNAVIMMGAVINIGSIIGEGTMIDMGAVLGGRATVGKRDPREVGMHSLRGGTVAGVHTVSFFGADEEVSLTHRATSRQIFVNGALAAARKMAGREPGFYGFDEVMFG